MSEYAIVVLQRELIRLMDDIDVLNSYGESGKYKDMIIEKKKDIEAALETLMEDNKTPHHNFTINFSTPEITVGIEKLASELTKALKSKGI